MPARATSAATPIPAWPSPCAGARPAGMSSAGNARARKSPTACRCRRRWSRTTSTSISRSGCWRFPGGSGRIRRPARRSSPASAATAPGCATAKPTPRFPGDEDVLAVGINRAVALIADKEIRQSRARGPNTVLRELGRHPGDGAPVRLKTGHYGPFVAHRRRYASLPKDRAPEDVTLDAAVALLERR